LSIYLITRADRNAGDLHLSGSRYKTSHLRTARFVCDCRTVVYRPTPPDPVTLSAMKKPANFPYATMATQLRKRTHKQVALRQAHLLQAGNEAMQWGKGGRGEGSSKRKPAAVLYNYYLQALIQVYLRTGATNTHTKTQKEIKGKWDRVVSCELVSSTIRLRTRSKVAPSRPPTQPESFDPGSHLAHDPEATQSALSSERARSERDPVFLSAYKHTSDLFSRPVDPARPSSPTSSLAILIDQISLSRFSSAPLFITKPRPLSPPASSSSAHEKLLEGGVFPPNRGPLAAAVFGLHHWRLFPLAGWNLPCWPRRRHSLVGRGEGAFILLPSTNPGFWQPLLRWKRGGVVVKVVVNVEWLVLCGGCNGGVVEVLWLVALCGGRNCGVETRLWCR